MIDKKNFNLEINFLRFISVSLVFLYHLQLDLFSKGFLGVDIFFIISGYLISSLLLKNNSILDFYINRLNRIFPSLITVILIIIFFSYFILSPVQEKNLWQSISSLTLFVSNYFFYLEGGYFGLANLEKPLLHSWSISIEVIFYLFSPLFVYLFFKKSLFIYLLIFFIFLRIIIYKFTSFEYFYFDFLSKIILFLLGFLLYKIKIKNKYNNYIFIPGYLLIFFSLLIENYNLSVLLVSFGVSLIILFPSNSILINRIYQNRIILFFGKSSYCLYLIHFPIISFAYIQGSDINEINTRYLIILTTIFITILLYNFIELKLVNKKNAKKKILIYIIILTLLFTAGVYRHFNDKLAAIQKTFDKEEVTECHFDINENNDFDYKIFYSKICNIGDLKQKSSYFIFGDSHAYQLSHLINDVFLDLNINSYFIFKNGCPPLIIHNKEYENNDSSKLNLKNCLKLNNTIYEYVKNSNIKNIVLIARWNFFTSEGYNKNRKTSRYFGNNLDLAENQKLFERLLNITIDKYAKLGININIIADVPELKDHPYNIYSDAYKKKDIINFLNNSRINIEEFNESYKFILNLFDNLNNKKRIKVFFPHNTLCKDNKCEIGEVEKPFYKDANHISFEGSKLLKNDLTNFFLK